MTDKKKNYVKHKTKIIIVITFSSLFSLMVGDELFNHELKDINRALESVLLFVSISMGFISTSLSIFATVSNTRFATKLKNSKNSKRQFILTLGSTLLVGISIILCTIVYQIMLENAQNEKILMIVNYIWLFLIPLFIGLGYIIISVILKILFNDNK